MDFKKESGIIGMLKKYNSGRGVKAASSEEKTVCREISSAALMRVKKSDMKG